MVHTDDAHIVDGRYWPIIEVTVRGAPTTGQTLKSLDFLEGTFLGRDDTQRFVFIVHEPLFRNYRSNTEARELYQAWSDSIKQRTRPELLYAIVVVVRSSIIRMFVPRIMSLWTKYPILMVKDAAQAQQKAREILRTNQDTVPADMDENLYWEF